MRLVRWAELGAYSKPPHFLGKLGTLPSIDMTLGDRFSDAATVSKIGCGSAAIVVEGGGGTDDR